MGALCFIRAYILSLAIMAENLEKEIVDIWQVFPGTFHLPGSVVQYHKSFLERRNLCV